MFTWRVHLFLSEIKAGHWSISWYIFTDIISDYFTDSGLESVDNTFTEFRAKTPFYDWSAKLVMLQKNKFAHPEESARKFETLCSQTKYHIIIYSIRSASPYP